MRKKLHITLLLTLFTGIAFTQTTILFDSNTNNGTIISGGAVIQTIQSLVDGSEYILTASHNTGGGAALWNVTSTDQIFYHEVALNGEQIWTVSLTKDGDPTNFTLNAIDYQKFCGQSISFTVLNDEANTIASAPNIATNQNQGDSFDITGNNEDISSFTIETVDFQGTQCVDFDNISITVENTSPSLSINEENDTSFKITASPNPTTNNVTIKFNNLTVTENVFNVFNVSGHLIKTQKSNNLQETIDLSSFESGFYFLEIISNNQQVKTLKLVKK